jgi:hypothetical protein
MPENAINVGDFTNDILDWGGGRVRSVDARARQAIREKPIVYLLGAVVLGALIGRFVSRW